MISFAVNLLPPLPPKPPGLIADTVLIIPKCSCSTILPVALVMSIMVLVNSLTCLSTLMLSISTLSLISVSLFMTLAIVS